MQTVPGGMPAKTFLASYWQKKPLLIRKAFKSWKPALSRAQLLAISTTSDASSRLVQYDPKADHWSLDIGPFPPSTFKALRNKCWTVLVQDMDTMSEPVHDVLSHFDFIPQWRTDDVMISYASKGGNVGPHVDNYDVFLIQTQGRRRWQIEKRKVEEDIFRADCDLRILTSFKPDYSWDLEPGDMLYLPPRIPHYGVSLDDECMTYSVGYRAPRYIDLLQEFISTETNAPSLFEFYTDKDRKLTKFSGEVAGRDLKDLYRAISSFKMNETNFKRWMLRQLSEPKYDFIPLNDAPRHKQPNIKRATGTKALYTVIKGKPFLCVNGAEYDLKDGDLSFCQLVTSRKKISAKELAALSKKQRALLESWVALGWFKETAL